MTKIHSNEVRLGHVSTTKPIFVVKEMRYADGCGLGPVLPLDWEEHIHAEGTGRERAVAGEGEKDPGRQMMHTHPHVKSERALGGGLHLLQQPVKAWKEGMWASPGQCQQAAAPSASRSVWLHSLAPLPGF